MAPDLSKGLPKISQKDVDDLITAQKALMKTPSEKISPQDLVVSVGSVYNACNDIKQNIGNSISLAKKKDFFIFVDSWMPWVDKALKANANGLKGIDPDNALGTFVNSVSKERLFYSNLVSVLSMYEGYPGGKPLSPTQAEVFAHFLTKMADKTVANYYQCRLLVEGMMEVVSGRSPDNWNFTFPNGDAKDFVENVLKNGLPPGFKADNIQSTKTSVSFTLAPAPVTEDKISDFLTSELTTAPKQQIKMKTTPIKTRPDGVTRLSTSSKTSFSEASISASYTADKKAALAATSDQPFSCMEKTMQQKVSAAVYYGEKFETDQFRSKGIAEEQVKNLIYDLASRFGFVIPPDTLNAWLVSKEPGKGQEFLNKLKAANITLDVTGSADMAMYFDGKNKAEWASVADKNLKLAEQRSSLVIARLKEFNTMIMKADPGNTGFAFSDKPKGKLHFFQDGLPAEAAKYSYTPGDGAANMSALMAYLKTIKDAKPVNLDVAADGAIINPNKITPIYAAFRVGENTINFTQKDKEEATKYYDKLLKTGAVVQDGAGYKAGNASLLNKYFRRMDGDPSLNGAPGAKEGMIYEGKVAKSTKDNYIPPNIFSRAMTESTEVSSRSVSLVYLAKAYLSISTEVKGGKVDATAEYRINDVPVKFVDGMNGTLDKETKGDRTIAIASTKDGSISSGYAWQTVAEEVKQEMHNTTQTNGRPVAGRKNEYNTIPFYAVNNVTMPGKEPYRENVDARVAFEALGDKFQILGFLSPGRNLVSTESCYSADGKEIAIVRGITLNGIDYSKEDLLGKLNSRAVGIKVGDSVVALDGTTQLEMQDSWTEKDGLVYAPKAQQSAKKVVVREGLISGQRFGKARIFDKNFIPYYVILPTKDVEFGKGGEKLSPRQIERLAKQGYTSLVKMAGSEATVFDLNGNRLGLYSERDEPAAKVRGIYCYVPKEMQGDNKKAADKDALSEDRQYWFNYPQQVYGPSDATYIQGIIRPVTRFNKRKVE